MSPSLLKEHRCACGKLLFKGFLGQCLVEVKCRRCSAVTMWGLAEDLSYAIVESDENERATAAFGDVASLLGYNREQVIGLPITDLFPLLRDKLPSMAKGEYQLKEMPLMLRDAEERHIESCIVPRYVEGEFAGYRIFSIPKTSSGA